MTWVEIGWIGKPHGLRGDFLVTGDAMPENPPEPGDTLRLRFAEEGAEEHEVLQVRYMPKGWVLRIAGIDSPEAVKTMQRVPLFFHGGEVAEDAFSPSDLQGFSAVDATTGALVGSFDGIEFLPAGPDRWWFKNETGTWSVPAIEQYIRKIDRAAKRIEISNSQEFTELL